jgi:CheY-like chemotaxis protein
MPHKLLLADDSVTIQRVIELTFADEDVQVHAVGDGQKAIAAIEADRPDIVLADVGMPERDGYEVSAFIKGNPQLAHIPVLLLTGAFEPVDEARARAVGCDGVLVKPFEPQMVINRVKDLLAGRRGAGTQPTPAAPPPARSVAGQQPNASGASASTPGPPSGSLEDYFDRLDAAFATLEGGAPPPSQATHGGPPSVPPGAVAPIPADVVGGWDPDLTAGAPKIEFIESPPSVPEPAPSPPVQQEAQPVETVPASHGAATTGPQQPVAPRPVPTLAEAFAALLSAEQSRQIIPSAIAARGPEVGEDVIEEIARRVVARLGDSVLDAAERLVREEIDRIKRG